MRYPDDIIAELLNLVWWDRPIDKIEAHLPGLERSDLAALKWA